MPEALRENLAEQVEDAGLRARLDALTGQDQATLGEIARLGHLAPPKLRPAERVLHPGRVERRPPAALVALAQLEVEALAMHPHGDAADAGP